VTGKLRHASAILLAALVAGCGASLTDETAIGPNNLTDTSSATALGGNSVPTASGSKTTDAATAAARVSTAAATAPSAPKAGGYKIGPYDVLEVTVFKVPELTKSVQVADSGSINLPLVGELPAAGRTAQDVERDLTRKLGAKYLQSPQVSVFVKEFNSQRITIDGSVKKPGVFPYRNSVSLLQAIAMADGLDKDSDSTIVVFRVSNGKKSAARFDVSEIRDGKAEDPDLQPGDTIIAGQSMIKTTFNNVLRVLPSAGLFMGL
jgi:polysaccharide export outer membrane protein